MRFLRCTAGARAIFPPRSWRGLAIGAGYDPLMSKAMDFLRRYAAPILLAGAIVATAPIMGQLRDLFFRSFPGFALRAIGILLAGIALALFLVALWRIRENRLWRYGGLLLVFALLWLQVAGFSRGIAQVDVVERFHVLEYGTLAALCYYGLRRRRPAPGRLELALLPIFAATLAGVADETAQRIFQLRVADFRDVGLNAFAALVGVLFAALMAPPKDLAPAAAGLPRVLRTSATTVLGLGLFAVAAHFGHEIADQELGRFRSFHDLEGLKAAAADRKVRWAADPPNGGEPWALKDLFLEEATRHTTYRNGGLDSGDLAGALRANQILEKYYGPFLDVEGYRGSGGHRWPPSLEAELEAKLQASGSRPHSAGFESPVLRDHLVLIPRGPFLAGLLALVLLLLAAARRADRAARR